MPRYSYTARNAGGQTFTDTADVPSRVALGARLADEGTTIQTARVLSGRIPRIKGVPFFEITGLYRQMASSIEAGLPLAEALQMLSSESRNARVKSLIHFLRAQVSEAMQQFPSVFPRVHVAAVRAGEESGRLEKALDDLAEQAEAF